MMMMMCKCKCDEGVDFLFTAICISSLTIPQCGGHRVIVTLAGVAAGGERWEMRSDDLAACTAVQFC